MSDIQALTSNDVPAVARVDTIPLRANARVAVEIADSRLMDLRPAWTDLLTRADAPNVFMDPALLSAAAAAYPEAHCRMLLAWRSHNGGRQLVGVWAFGIGRAPKSALPVQVLTVPPYLHAHLATPVIDRSCLDETLDAMLDRLADDPQLPSIVALDSIATEGRTFEALTRVLAARGTAPRIMEQFRRPKLASELDGKTYLEKALSGSSRKKLRQHRRRLAEKGALSFAIASEPEAVRRATEEFLTLEAAGWKGNEGTALLCDESHAAFMRSAVGTLADQGRAAIHALYLDGRPVSMQVLVRSGGAAFTWKTTYDEQYHDYSPGMLLLEDYTTAMLADPSVAYVDSCARGDDGFMSVWTERQIVADLWIDTVRDGSLAFQMFGAMQKRYRDLRATAKHHYLALQRRRAR